ncbi:uncharacterized protein [Rutidosis leptorrhynchoides]|uniref:uncharacterized protein n=1 Tax=Rutidosis leptorrhynchoides TaxID=125765 RepID=UPI003A99409A
MIRRGHSINNIRGLAINGGWSEDPSEIKEAVFNHYKEIFEDRTTSRPSLGDLSNPSLTVDEAERLEIPIGNEEILETISGCGNNKAPGPDGFNLRLRKVMHRLVGSEQSAFLKEGFILDGVLIANESLEYMKAHKKKRKWIMSCLSSASISILVNGSPTREFSMGRGVRQGDPLSPFLFILAAEGLNILTKAAVDRGLFKGV